MDYCLNLGVWNSVFAVPSVIVDEYLKIASPIQIKVLLYLLRNAGAKTEVENIVEAVGFKIADVEDALKFWIDAGIIKMADDVLSAGDAAKEIPMSQVKESPEKAPKKTLKIHSAPTRPSREECARLLEQDEIKQLVLSVQEQFGRLLIRSEIDVLISIPSWSGLPVSVIMMIVSYCCSIDKKNVRFIEKTAIIWSDKEIDTPEKADAYLARISCARSAWNKVRGVIGIIDRKPTEKEMNFCLQWVDGWKFSDEMIKEAYDRCVDSTGKLSMAYINRILERWEKEGIFTKKDLLDFQNQNDKKTSKKETTKRSASYDMNELERKLNEDTFSDWGGDNDGSQ